MTSLREEIEAELKHVRLDKTALYNILLKMVDQGVGGVALVVRAFPVLPVLPVPLAQLVLPAPPDLKGPKGDAASTSAAPKADAATSTEEKPKKKAAPKKKTRGCPK